MWPWIFRALSPAGPGGRLQILIFHRVHPDVDALFPDEMSATRFDGLCGRLRRWFNVVDLHRAIAQLHLGTLPERALAITFDDGYADNLEIAAPILVRHGLTATFFVATGFVDGSCMWNDGVIECVRACRHDAIEVSDASGGVRRLPLATVQDRRAAIEELISRFKYLPRVDRDAAVNELARRCAVAPPRGLMMSAMQLRGLRDAGMALGAHTVNHPILRTLADAEGLKEIADSKVYLESLLDEPVPLFAYPNGKPDVDYDARAVEWVRRAGFEAALTTQPGVGDDQADLFQLPRFTPWDKDWSRFALRLAMNHRRRGPRSGSTVEGLHDVAQRQAVPPHNLHRDRST